MVSTLCLRKVGLVHPHLRVNMPLSGRKVELVACMLAITTLPDEFSVAPVVMKVAERTVSNFSLPHLIRCREGLTCSLQKIILVEVVCTHFSPSLLQ